MYRGAIAAELREIGNRVDMNAVAVKEEIGAYMLGHTAGANRE
jgi:hypothetical protein